MNVAPRESERDDTVGAVDRVVAALETAGIRADVRRFEQPVPTAVAAAEALGCEVGAIANSLLFDSGGQPVLILTSGAHRVDTAKVARDLGVAPLRRAAPDFVREHTGQVIGGGSPINHRRAIPTYLDVALRSHPEIWAAAGHPAAVFSTTYDQLLALNGATEVEVD